MATISIECPVCEDNFELEVEHTRGSPPSGMSGPPENYDPGEAPETYFNGIIKVCPDCKAEWTPEQKNTVDIAIEKACEDYEDDGSDYDEGPTEPEDYEDR